METRRADTADTIQGDARPVVQEPGPVLLFDGICNRCSGAVRFVIPRDHRGKIRFASLQSEAGRGLLRGAGVPPEAAGADPETMILLDGGRVYERSSAALRLAGTLDGGWPLLGIFLAIPAPLRDLVYRWVARNRYRWFGKRENCYVPEADESWRFLDADETGST
jgi:predicted DCC family thiol-disulfide oxidoreductase YuxK